MFNKINVILCSLNLKIKQIKKSFKKFKKIVLYKALISSPTRTEARGPNLALNNFEFEKNFSFYF
jgi:hypothetical protein